MRRTSTALLLVLGGCMLGPDFAVPKVNVPEKYLESDAAGKSIANLPWWEVFKDEALKRLIEAALAENLDVEIAVARIAEARAALGFVKADQYPSLGYGGSASRVDLGDETSLGSTKPTNDFRASADVFFEVDLWGKLRRATESARGELLATEAAYVTVIITLVADVANSYLLLVDLDAQLKISRDTLKTRQDATRIIRQRFGEGVVSKLDVHQAEIEETTAEVSVAALQRAIAQTEHALRVLLGRTPGRIPRSKSLQNQLPQEIPIGLPSELLRRRPDVQVAENVAAAQTARIGVAEALRFPSLSLTGALGFASKDMDDLIDAKSRFWSIGADVTGPLFEFGKNVRRVEVEEARTRQAVLDYERTVLEAFREVEDALVAVRTFRLEYEARTRQVAAAKGAARLARALYDEQFTSYLDTLDAERSLFDAQLGQSAALRAHLQAIVRLYKALGGGWLNGSEEEPVEGGTR
ncbi:MAG: efflux transporter outer membrane subunit [Planctomycetota bacterium]|jgi:multidrug efflux system outer membrane protein